jgi:phosphatidylethanolamine-binding protein (PEBP) family uncharacterized protein
MIENTTNKNITNKNITNKNITNKNITNINTTNKNTTNKNTTNKNTTNKNTTNINTTNINTTNKNTTRKLRNNTDIRNKAIISNYEKDIIEQNPQKLPITEFVDYTKSLYEPFVNEKEEKQRLNQNEIDLSDIFSIPSELLKPEKIANINTTSFKQNPSMSLDKFIAYSLLFKSFENFEANGINKGKLKISNFKNQVGKDVSRVDVKINGVELPETIIVPDNNYKTADNFNLYIMREMAKNQLLIQQNTIIKIDAIMCQDVFNFISQTISLFISNKVSPETATEVSATKNIEIILTNEEQSIIFNFNTRLMISYNKIYDPEYLCGKYSFKLKVDLKNNTYTLNDFNLSYNVDDCNPVNKNETANGIVNQSKDSQFKDNAYNAVANNPKAIAGVATTGILSGTTLALFLTGILGGKRQEKRQGNPSKRRLKTSKKRKSQGQCQRQSQKQSRRNPIKKRKQIPNFYQNHQCKRSPEYFLTNFSGPNYCGTKLLINYENMHYIRNGEFIPKAKARNSPYIKLTYVTKVEPFTLIMNDANANTASGNVVHWTIVNITPISKKYIDNSILPGITFRGKPLYGRIILLEIPPSHGGGTTYYLGPSPPQGSGFHKYAFTLYIQRGKITYTGPIPIEESQQDLFSQLGISQSDSISSLYFKSSYYPN